MESVAKGLDDTEGALWRLQMRSGWLISDFMIIWSVDMAGGPKQGLKWRGKNLQVKRFGNCEIPYRELWELCCDSKIETKKNIY